MMQQMLMDIGLKPNEATLYLALLRIGTTHAGRLVIETKLPKATVYDTLESLEKKGLVHSYVHAKTMKYTAEDPEYIQHLLGKEAKKIKQKQQQFSSILPELYGIRNEHFQLPKIRMYQGMEGIRTVFMDGLTAQEPILAYVNDGFALVNEDFKHVKQEYIDARIQKKIWRHIITMDTPFLRELFSRYRTGKFTEARFMPSYPYDFTSELAIYDNKVTIVTYRNKEPIGVIIEDEAIYSLQKLIHQQLWHTLANTTSLA